MINLLQLLINPKWWNLGNNSFYQRHKLAIHFLISGALFSGQLVFYITFLGAYFTPNKAILITINEYGEANIELILTSFVTICGLIHMAFMLNLVKNERGKEN